MAKGYQKGDSNNPQLPIDRAVLIELIQQRIKAIKAVERRTVVQDAKPDTNDMEVRINMMVQSHIYGTIKELELLIKMTNEL